MIRAIFLDDGGVLSDNVRRMSQWREQVGAYLSRELGGPPERWAEANRVISARAWTAWLELMVAGVPLDRARRTFDVGWMRGMAEHAGRVLPTDDDEVCAIADRTARYVTERIRAFHPEITTTLRRLHARGHALRTASGEREADLDGYLRAEGVRDLFGTLYGTDLVDAWKGSRAYYDAVFVHAGVRPRDAIVVDDSAEAVRWAREAGATAYLMDRAGASDDPNTLRSLADLLTRL